jgi:hypothetical protein
MASSGGWAGSTIIGDLQTPQRARRPSISSATFPGFLQVGHWTIIIGLPLFLFD